MNSKCSPDDAIRELVNQFLDGSIADSDLVVLEKAIRENPAARQVFMEYCHLHIDLAVDTFIDVGADRALEEFHRQQQRVTSAVPSAARTSVVKFQFASTFLSPPVVFAFGIIVAMIFSTVWFKAYPGRPTAHMASFGASDPLASEGRPTGPALTPVGYLTSANGCAWGSGVPQVRTVGSSVQLGDEVMLHEGIAEFRLSSGVSISIEGPAALILTSPTSLVLQHGKVSAYVPWAVTDFKLVAPSCRLMANDAEFGVRVAGDEVDIHVFSGELLATPALEGEQKHELLVVKTIEHEEELASGSQFSKAVIAAGRGLDLVSRGDVTTVASWHNAEKSQFATKLTMAGTLPITNAYVKSILASKPVGYWRFENYDNGWVENEIEGGVRLRVVGNDLSLSGDSQNRAAELGRPGSNSFLISPEPIRLPASDEYSVEIWIKPSHTHDGNVLSLIAAPTVGTKSRTAFCLQLWGSQQNYRADQRDRVRFLHRDPPSEKVGAGTSCFSGSPYTIRRWQHVAAVKTAKEMRLYFDGALVVKQDARASLAENLYVLLGKWNVDDRLIPFIGQLDELAIYSHALSREEIAQHIQSINWTPVRASASREEI